jgi:hypothetical protein
MNRLDNLPNDIMKIINRKVQDLHIIERRVERKRNRANNRLLKKKKDIRIKFMILVLKYYGKIPDEYFYWICQKAIYERIESNISKKEEILNNFQQSRFGKLYLCICFTRRYDIKRDALIPDYYKEDEDTDEEEYEDEDEDEDTDEDTDEEEYEDEEYEDEEYETDL